MLAYHVLISIFELGSKVSKIVTTETFGGVSLPKNSRPKHVIIVLVVTKGKHIILIIGGNKQNISTIMQMFFFIIILVCFSS